MLTLNRLLASLASFIFCMSASPAQQPVQQQVAIFGGG